MSHAFSLDTFTLVAAVGLLAMALGFVAGSFVGRQHDKPADR